MQPSIKALKNNTMNKIEKTLLEALEKLVEHSAKVNYAFYVEGKQKALLAAMQGQKELLDAARKAIARAKE